jgi:hypothetical protein
MNSPVREAVEESMFTVNTRRETHPDRIGPGVPRDLSGFRRGGMEPGGARWRSQVVAYAYPSKFVAYAYLQDVPPLVFLRGGALLSRPALRIMGGTGGDAPCPDHAQHQPLLPDPRMVLPQVLAELSAAWNQGLMFERLHRKYPLGFIEPYLPTAGNKPPTGPQWVHEIKFGYHDQPRFWCSEI